MALFSVYVWHVIHKHRGFCTGDALAAYKSLRLLSFKENNKRPIKKLDAAERIH